VKLRIEGVQLSQRAHRMSIGYKLPISSLNFFRQKLGANLFQNSLSIGTSQ
jgi:hypothetical protein